MSGWFSYERIGLYYRTRKGRRNFCDLHFWGAADDLGKKGRSPGDRPHGHQGSYAGPKSPIIPTYFDKKLQTKKAFDENQRTNDDYELYDRICREHAEPDWEAAFSAACARRGVDRGGVAQVIYTDRNTYDCWLFGPLRLDGSGAYGSLVADLEGFDEYLWDNRMDPFDKPRTTPPPTGRWPHPIKGRVGVFRSCALWGSHDTGRNVTISQMSSYLTDPKRSMFPAFLPRDVISIEWKVEDTGVKLSDVEIHKLSE